MSDTTKPVSMQRISNKTQHPPWSRILLEMLENPQLVKKSLAFCGTRRWYILLPLHFKAHLRLPFIRRITLFQELQEHSIQHHITELVHSLTCTNGRLLHAWGTKQDKNGVLRYLVTVITCAHIAGKPSPSKMAKLLVLIQKLIGMLPFTPVYDVSNVRAGAVPHSSEPHLTDCQPQKIFHCIRFSKVSASLITNTKLELEPL
jgi:hypothetical protein